MSSQPYGLGTVSDSSGRLFPALITDVAVLDLSDREELGNPHDTPEILRGWAEREPVLAELADSSDGWQALDGLRILPPVQPENILQSGANYRTHVLDLVTAEFDGTTGATLEEARRSAVARLDKRASEGVPYMFTGMRSAMCGANDDVVLPLEGDQHDWELELAVVIGEGGSRISETNAANHIAGYVMCNDLTVRDLLYRKDMIRIGSDWVASKNRPTFLPVGPWIAPASTIADVNDLKITLRLNGEVMQDESPADMIFGVPQLVAYASRLINLLPGDLILTGSPAGNGAHYGRFLTHGDVMESTITGLGTQRNRCVSQVAAAH